MTRAEAVNLLAKAARIMEEEGLLDDHVESDPDTDLTHESLEEAIQLLLGGGAGE